MGVPGQFAQPSRLTSDISRLPALFFSDFSFSRLFLFSFPFLFLQFISIYWATDSLSPSFRTLHYTNELGRAGTKYATPGCTARLGALAD